MTCRPLVDAEGRTRGFVCGPGPYTHLVEALCPWCCVGDDPPRVCGFREIFSGYEAPDLICGDCGQFFSAEYGPRKMSEEGREENKARVQALRDAGLKVGPWPMSTALLGDPDYPENG